MGETAPVSELKWTSGSACTAKTMTLGAQSKPSRTGAETAAAAANSGEHGAEPPLCR
jgi:hypothetical protein